MSSATPLGAALLYFEPNCENLLAELVDVEGKLALEVGGFVFGDCILSGETVEHGLYFAVFLSSFCFVGYFTEVANSVAQGFAVITVAKTTALGLTYSFLR